VVIIPSPIYSNGFISSIHKNTLTPFYSTTSVDEVIEFKETDGTQRDVNGLTIEANSTDLYIKIDPSDYCIFIKANTSKSINYQSLQSITVMGAAGQSLRWLGQFY
jgi:hypothetical protein